MPSDAMRTMGWKSSSTSGKETSSQPSSGGVMSSAVDTVKSGAGWVSEKASDVVETVKDSNIPDKVKSGAGWV